jgi:trimethylamine:corrinoid methyltransferase-like protein
LLNRASHDRWLEGGGLDVTEKARQKARELLATHEVQALPAELIARLDAVVPAG